MLKQKRMIQLASPVATILKTQTRVKSKRRMVNYFRQTTTTLAATMITRLPGYMSMDFRSEKEIEFSNEFESKGYIKFQAFLPSLEKLKISIEKQASSFVGKFMKESDNRRGHIKLDKIHTVIPPGENNKLKLHVMKELSSSKLNNYLYYQAAKEGIQILCGSELAMQKRISLSVQIPYNTDDILPVHADTWNGVSPFDLNIWIPLVNCRKTMCLYILGRQAYNLMKDDYLELLLSDSTTIYNVLKDHVTLVDINYGEILAFDQSLPHGYCLNEEGSTQWSLNCRFKNIFAPYEDKLLGDYYIPITTRSMTKIGIGYEEPKSWL